jgi:2-C-methyl-D-erythritol 4-phosphate cytidylyltransferase
VSEDRRQTSAAILLAAGKGTRMAGTVEDKVLQKLGRRSVFDLSLRAFAAAEIVDSFVIVYRDQVQRGKIEALVPRSIARKYSIIWVRGGRERQDSVASALKALTRKRSAGFVFIHDCARPLVRPETLRELDVLVRREGAACLAHRVTDTIKKVPGDGAAPVRKRLRTLDRRNLWAMETPQAFELSLIADAYRVVIQRGLSITDDLSALELASDHRVSLVENPHPNPKITRPSDLAYAGFLLENLKPN